jgi:hypothetical protein
MKKVLLLTATLFTSVIYAQQSAFFQEVTYRGAFAPTPTPAWTAGWTEFDPQNAVYPATTVNVNGNISTNTTWTAGNVYLLNDVFVYVLPGNTLTIEPGTIIRGTGKGTLIVERGAKIFAQGTATNPIVFTSNEAPGNRDYGDWGGVVICGAARHNLATGVNAEAEGGIGDANTGRGVFGGNNDNDDSGIFTYCRIEFCGISLTPQSNSEINGLTLYSVGKQTEIHHVQVSYCGDDSFEWFGGTVDSKYLVALRGWDDDFDTDNGFRGRVQFAFSLRDPAIADQSGSNGFESDNDKDGSIRAPKTAPVFSNVTIIGPNYSGNTTPVNSLYQRGLHLRRNTATSTFNSIFTGYPEGLRLDGKPTTLNACEDTLIFRRNILAGHGQNFRLANGDTGCITSNADLVAWAMNTVRGTDTLVLSNDVNLVSPFNLTNPDARPNSNSIAVTGAPDFTHPYLQPLQTTGIENSMSVQATLFPNPAHEIVRLQINSVNPELFEINIFDISGRLIQNEGNFWTNGGENVLDINVSSLNPGIYIIQISSATSNLSTRFIKQ